MLKDARRVASASPHGKLALIFRSLCLPWEVATVAAIDTVGCHATPSFGHAMFTVFNNISASAESGCNIRRSCTWDMPATSTSSNWNSSSVLSSFKRNGGTSFKASLMLVALWARKPSTRLSIALCTPPPKRSLKSAFSGNSLAFMAASSGLMHFVSPSGVGFTISAICALANSRSCSEDEYLTIAAGTYRRYIELKRLTKLLKRDAKSPSSTPVVCGVATKGVDRPSKLILKCCRNGVASNASCRQPAAPYIHCAIVFCTRNAS
mmetsp:Transcript_114612/g.208510  ORF Transcript_114612/g.208510 Transcript_114612/m.208510 type:complete len:265 (+) Transcript_114612:1907-2701(+)